MQTAASESVWRGGRNGANVRTLMARSPYPVDEHDEPGKIRFTASLEKETHAELDLIEQVWNALDAALKIKRKGGQWKATSSVIQQLVASALDEAWEQLGGKPATPAAREELVRAFIEKHGSKLKKK